MKWLLTTSKLVYFARRRFSRANVPLLFATTFSKCCHSIEFVSLFIVVFADLSFIERAIRDERIGTRFPRLTVNVCGVTLRKNPRATM